MHNSYWTIKSLIPAYYSLHNYKVTITYFIVQYELFMSLLPFYTGCGSFVV